MLRTLSLEDFGRAVVSEDAVPGGGSVSALAAALAAALAGMVATLTIKKQKEDAPSPSLADLRDEAARLQNELMAAVDGDADSYRKVLAAFRLPRASEDERRQRSAAIQDAFLAASRVPLQVARSALRVLELAGRAVREGHPDMITDAGVGVLMARSAALGALMNVKINLASIKDQDLVARMKSEADDLKAAVLEKERAFLELIAL